MWCIRSSCVRPGASLRRGAGFPTGGDSGRIRDLQVKSGTGINPAVTFPLALPPRRFCGERHRIKCFT